MIDSMQTTKSPARRARLCRSYAVDLSSSESEELGVVCRFQDLLLAFGLASCLLIGEQLR